MNQTLASLLASAPAHPPVGGSWTLGINGLFTNLFFGESQGSDYGTVAGLDSGSDALFLFIWYVGVFFFLLVVGLMGYFAWKYRRVPGKAVEPSASHNTALEITWTVIPTIILFLIFFWGYQGYVSAQTAPVEAEQIELNGYKWGWTFTYDNGKQSAETQSFAGESSQIPIFYVPEDTPVRLKMSSSDVIHSFWVPDFRTKLDVMPNRYQPYWFRAKALSETPDKLESASIKIGEDDLGEPIEESYEYRDHWIFCAEYCGDQHSQMAAVLRVVPMGVYQAWKSDPGYEEGITPLCEVGELVWKAKGCNACHSIDGAAKAGPTWLNNYRYDVPLSDGSIVAGNDVTEWENYVRESILYPAAKIHEGYPNQMPSYNGRISDFELRGVIAYMKTLSDRASESERNSACSGGEADGAAEGDADGIEEDAGEDAGAMGNEL
ncbi:MAG: cytochrome c oxidase subunit II [Planctomycetota bacterium]